jgi:branched-chain amino acid aminotransferase
MPVSRVDGKPVKGVDAIGPISAKIRDLFWEKRAQGWKATPIAY